MPAAAKRVKEAAGAIAPVARVAAIERDRWIGYPAGDAGILRLTEIYSMRARVRMPCLLIYGVSGAGKTMLLEKFQRDHAVKAPKREGRRSIVATQMPPVPVIRSLYSEIVRSLNGNIRSTFRFYELENIAIEMLTHAAPRMLIIDEIQHLLSCSARDQRAALNAIKFLSNQLRMTIVAAGTYEALHVLRFDPQIASRFEQMELPVWVESEELRRFVAGYLSMLPIRKDTSAIDRRFIEYLLELTDGITGRIIDVLRRAAVHALTLRTKSVGIEELQYVGTRLPAMVSQRS